MVSGIDISALLLEHLLAPRYFNGLKTSCEYRTTPRYLEKKFLVEILPDEDSRIHTDVEDDDDEVMQNRGDEEELEEDDGEDLLENMEG